MMKERAECRSAGSFTRTDDRERCSKINAGWVIPT